MIKPNTVLAGISGKRLLLLLLLILPVFFAGAQTVLWEENFDGESNGATSGTAGGTIGGPWSVTSLPPNGAGSFSRQDDGGLTRFTVNGTGNGEGVWSSGIINISSAPEVAIEMSLVEYYSSDAQDYLRAYYRLDGGPEILFGSIEGGGAYDITANASVILAGSSLEIVVRGRENSPSRFFGFIPTFLRFDDVTLVQISTLYSRVNGNWNNGTTWSTTRNGPSCGCTPNAGTHVVIEDIVNMNVDGDAVNVTIESGGSLRYTGNNNLTIHRGGDINVHTGGSINRNGNNAALIEFTWAGVTNNVTINGNADIGILRVPAATTVSFSGTGNLTISDDLLITAAATITNNKTGGTFTVTDDLNFGTDNATFTNNHILSVNDLVSANGNDGNTFSNTAGGTFNVGTIAPGNGNLRIDNFGTINQSGNFVNNSIDTGSEFNNRSTGTWNFSRVGGTNDASILTVLNCTDAGNTFNFNGAGNQDIFDIQYHHLTLSTSGTKSLTDNVDVNGNLTIRDAAVFNTTGDNISLGGDWTVLNSGTFNQGNGTITFDGGATQSITNAAGQTFTEMVVNKPSGEVILIDNVTIANGTGTDLTLTSGNITSSASALLIVNDEATTSGGNVNSFVNGPVRKIGNNNFVFPTGKNGQFARIALTNLSGATNASQFTAEYFDAPHSNLAVDGSLAHISHAEYWTLTRAVNSPNANVVLYWQDSFSDITNLADLTVARFTGADWTNAGRSATTGVPAGPGTITSNAISNFNAFTFASLGGINPLPVELLYFKAVLVNDQVELAWETASELNNDYFTIERAANAEKFVTVNKVKGKGNSREKTRYSAIDRRPLYGRSYYRLKQTDFDGTVSYSDLTFVDYDGPEFPTLSVYPNPSIGKTITVMLEGFEKDDEVPVVVMDAQGRQLFRTMVTIPDRFAVTQELRLLLPEGIYIIRAGLTKYLTQKVVVE